MKFKFIKENSPAGLTTKLCKELKVSTSGYYKYLSDISSKRAKENKILESKIASIYKKSKKTYGSPRIHKGLLKNGIRCGENRVARIMNRMGLNANLKRKFRIKTTDSNHNGPIAPRVFKTEETPPQKAGEVWSGDITYIPFNDKFLYLSVILDIGTREVVGWNIRKELTSDGVVDALKMAIGLKGKNPGTIFHSDRGVQYASKDFRGLLNEEEMRASMSRKGNCYDNAYVESFFRTFKTELIYRNDFKCEKNLRSEIFEYIEIWYNRKRMHSSLGYLSPLEYTRETNAA